jgi:6-phosphogluconolactonase
VSSQPAGSHSRAFPLAFGVCLLLGCTPSCGWLKTRSEGSAPAFGSTGGADGGALSRSGGDFGKDAAATMSSSTTNATGVARQAEAPYVYTSGKDPDIGVFTLDMATGALTRKGVVTTGLANPTYLAVSPDRRYLYAANETEDADGKIVAFQINHADGSLQKINEAKTGGSGAAHLSVHPSGRWVLVANYVSGHLATLPVNADGGLGTPPADIRHPGATSHQAISDEAGAFVFVPNLDANTVFQFKLDTATGKLTENGAVAGYPSGAAPRHIAFHPNGKWAYTINEVAVTVTSLSYDALSGKLSDPQTASSLPKGAVPTETNMYSGAHIVVHPSGRFVYASNRGHNSISLFEVNLTTGRLTLRANETGGGAISTPRDFDLDPTGKFLVVGNQNSATVTTFEIDPASGKLTKKGTWGSPPKPCFVAVVPL